MTQVDRDRLVTLRKVEKKIITQKQAGEELGLSVRTESSIHVAGQDLHASCSTFSSLRRFVGMRRLNGQFPLPPNQVVIGQILVGLFQRLHAGHAHPFHQPV